MSRLFLGKWWHWAMLVACVGALWLAGHEKLHVVHFNAFVLSLLAGAAVVVAVLIAGTRPGERVTREPLAGDAEASPGHEDVRARASDAD